MRAAFSAARLRARGPRFRAALWACRASAVFEAALWPSRFKARLVARERVRDTAFRGIRPFLVSRAALRRVSADTVPFFGGRR